MSDRRTMKDKDLLGFSFQKAFQWQGHWEALLSSLQTIFTYLSFWQSEKQILS